MANILKRRQINYIFHPFSICWTSWKHDNWDVHLQQILDRQNTRVFRRLTMVFRLTEISGVDLLPRKRKLQCRNGHFLEVRPDGTVRGTKNNDSIYSKYQNYCRTITWNQQKQWIRNSTFFEGYKFVIDAMKWDFRKQLLRGKRVCFFRYDNNVERFHYTTFLLATVISMDCSLFIEGFPRKKK